MNNILAVLILTSILAYIIEKSNHFWKAMVITFIVFPMILHILYNFTGFEKFISILIIIFGALSLMENRKKHEKEKDNTDSSNSFKNNLEDTYKNNILENMNMSDNDMMVSITATSLKNMLESKFVLNRKLTDNEILNLMKNFRFASKNLDEDDVYQGIYDLKYKYYGEDKKNLYHPLFDKWKIDFTESDEKLILLLENYGKKYSEFLSENSNKPENANLSFDEFICKSYNEFSYISQKNYYENNISKSYNNYVEIMDSFIEKSKILYPKYIEYFNDNQEYYCIVGNYIMLSLESDTNSITYATGKSLEDFLKEHIAETRGY